MGADSILRSSLEETHWITRIRELLERDDLQTAIGSSTFIFQVPDSVRNRNSDAYLPCRIALGPHHHFRPELYKMQFYKLHMAKKAREELQLSGFHQLHDQFMQLELKIRACFDTHLNISGDTLAWMMLVDSLFLLQLLANVWATQKGNPQRRFLLPLPNLEDQNILSSFDERFVAQFQILNDALKLENQIPVLTIKAILPSSLSAKFPLFLYHFSRSVSPFDLSLITPQVRVGETDFPNLPAAILDRSHHLLHFIYLSTLITPLSFRISKFSGESSVPFNFLKKWLSILGFVLNISFMKLLEIFGMVKKQSSTQQTTSSSVVPSASQLEKVHVKFKPTENGILGTKFIKDSATLILPIFTVNAFTETLFENLVAFEAMANIDPPTWVPYLELMKAFIPTTDDLKILKDSEIVFSNLGSDEEVVKIFKGVGSSISTLKNPSLEKLIQLHQSKLQGLDYLLGSEGSTPESDSEAKIEIFEEIKRKYEEGLKGIIEEINQYYESCRRVKAERFVKMYVYPVMKMLVILGIVLFMFLVAARLVNSSRKLFKSIVFVVRKTIVFV